jgi:hypothetical protein
MSQFDKQNSERRIKMENVRFRTINVVEETGLSIRGKITAATVPLDSEKKTFGLGLCFCGPNDMKKFNRKFGQKVALGRLSCDKSRIVIGKNPTVFEGIKDRAILIAAVKDIKWMRDVQKCDLV